MSSAQFTSPDSYDRFMGRYSFRLAGSLCDAAGIEAGMRVLDVGCGTGALTAELARRIGEENVTAVDPSPPFVAASRERHPTADVRESPAESLPFGDDTFDAALASLVVHFMSDPHEGVRQMARVTRPGGTVAACVWDMTDGMELLACFWRAARTLETPPEQTADARMGTREGQLGTLFREAGLADVREGTIESGSEYADFDEWWETFTLGVGPAGAFVESLSGDQRAALREACRAELCDPREPFTLGARAWFARGRVG